MTTPTARSWAANMQRQAVPLDPRRGAARRHRHGGDGGARQRRHHHRAALRRRRPGRRHAHRRARDRGDLGRRAGRRHLQPAEVPALEPEHLHHAAAAGEGGRRRERRRHHRRRSLDAAGRAGARAERALRLHAVERLQLRGFDPHLRAHRLRRRLHLDPYRGIRGDGARHQARPRGDHPRHPQCRRGSAQEPRRGRHRLYRRRGEAGRHPGRQGDAQGRIADDAGREAAPRHLRREGVGRARHQLAPAAGRFRHHRRGARLLAPRRRQGRARARHRALRDRAPRQGPRRRARDPRAQLPCALEGAAHRPGGGERSQGLEGRHQDQRGGAGGVHAGPMAADRHPQRQAHGRHRGAQEADGRFDRSPAAAFREQGREAAARRRAAARRHEDGQGLRRGEAQAAARRQDGGPPRQQGRHLQDHAGRGHALSRRRHSRRHRAEPAGRAVAA